MFKYLYKSHCCKLSEFLENKKEVLDNKETKIPIILRKREINPVAINK